MDGIFVMPALIIPARMSWRRKTDIHRSIPFASHLSKILNISGNTVWRNFLNWKESSGRVRVADHLLPYIPGGVAGVDQAYRVKKGSDS